MTLYFSHPGPDRRETSTSSILPPSSSSSSSSSSSTSISPSISTSASISSSSSLSSSTSAAYQFGVETGTTPPATMLPTPVQIQPPAEHLPVPFLSARARIAEFQRLREDLKRTEIERERQMERLCRLASEAACGFSDDSQCGGLAMPVAPIPVYQPGYLAVPEPIPTVGIPTGEPFHLPVNQFDDHQSVYPIPTAIPPFSSTSIPPSTSAFIPPSTSTSFPPPMPTVLPPPMPTAVPTPHHHQLQQLPHAALAALPCPTFVPRGRVSKACEHCKLRKVKCSGGVPCERCAQRGLECFYEKRKVRGPAKKREQMRDVPLQQVSSSSSTMATPATVQTRIPLVAPIPTHPLLQPPSFVSPSFIPSPPAQRQTLLSSVPSLSRSLFSPPTPAAPTLVTASGEVVMPTFTTPPQIIVTQPPSDLSGTPGGFFEFLDPSQETSLPGGVGPGCNPGPVGDFIIDVNLDLDFDWDFDLGLDSSLEVLGEVAREGEPLPTLSEPSVPKQAPTMPTIMEEEEDGDRTITPSTTQRAMLPPDRFRAHGGVEDDTLDTPRPRFTGAFAEPAQDPFDDSFTIDTSLEDSQDSQDGLLNQSDFSSASSSSVWEFMLEGSSSAEAGAGMQFQFPTINPSTDGNGTDVLTEDEFLKAIVAAAHSTPRNSGEPGHEGFELFFTEDDYNV